MESPMISVSMIVKNEEALLARCLETVKEADEIVIADTGSEDSTVEIAKKYTDKVFTDYKWEDSFCKARNHSLKKCIGDWILIIDADETLTTPFATVRQIINGAEEKGQNFVCIKVVPEKDPKNVMYFPRIFRNEPTVKWYGNAHNYLANSAGKKEIYTDDIEIVYGYSPAHGKDPDRTLRILKRSVKEDPTLVRERFYLGREYWYKKKYKEAVREFDKYLKVSTFRGERAEAYLNKARCLWYMQKGEEARTACLYAIYTNPDFKEALLFMSEMNYEPRKSIWKRYAEHAKNTHVIFNRTG